MKRWIIIWALAIFFSNSYGQEAILPIPTQKSAQIQDQLSAFLSADNPLENKTVLKEFENLVAKLEKTRTKRNSDYSFLRALFYKTHNSLLHEYDRLATMDETLASGNFGCLTGTAIYAILLEHFGFEYRIIELPNHVFIHLTANNQSYIFESTLPLGGFMTTTAEMDKILEQPWVNQRRISELSTVGEWFTDFKVLPGKYATINLEQLAGLQYFNESAKLYLKKDYSSAMDLALQAYELYPSERNEKLMQLVINKILKYETIKEELKSQYLDKYVSSIKGKKLSQTK